MMGMVLNDDVVSASPYVCPDTSRDGEAYHAAMHFVNAYDGMAAWPNCVVHMDGSLYALQQIEAGDRLLYDYGEGEGEDGQPSKAARRAEQIRAISPEFFIERGEGKQEVTCA